MKNKFFIIFLLTLSLASFTACTSSPDEEGEAVEEMADEGFSNEGEIAEEIGEEVDDVAEGQGIEELEDLGEGEEMAALEEEPAIGDQAAVVGDDLEDFGEDEFSEDGFGDDDFGEEAGGDELADFGDEELEPMGDMAQGEEQLLADDAMANEPALDDQAPLEELGGGFDPGTEDSFQDAAPAEMAAADEFSDMPSPEEPMGEPMMDAPMTKTWVSVKKVATVPFEKNGVLVNAVYLVRPGDDMGAISTKIYGSPDRAEELFAVNPGLRGSLDVGEKVYYNSPQRPNDNSSLLTYYEDMGLQPEVYVTKPGDNIREVSMNLLGDPASWKEVWATNMDVDSKGEVVEGLTLRYWANANVAAAPPAPEPEPALDPEPIPEPPPMEQADMPPPPPAPDEMPPPPEPTEVAQNEMPSPPPAAGTIEPPPPPPPPAPPAPPKKRFQKDQSAMASAQDMLNNPDQTMALGAAAILLIAAVALIVIIRKKKGRRTLNDFANTQTQTQIE